jgi:hypothetical protein
VFGPSSAKVRHWIFWPTPPPVAALFSASGALDPNYLKRLGIKAITAAELLAHVDEPELWKGLLTHKTPDVRLRTLQYLNRSPGRESKAGD